MRTAREKLLDNGVEDEVELIEEDVFRDSLVGVVFDPEVRAVYDFNKMVEEYAAAKNCSAEEAADYICYNLIRGFSYMNSNRTPLIYDSFVF